MIDAVLNFIKSEKLINKGEHIAVALSGGADSIALLHILISIRMDMDLTVEAIHIHHGIRRASDEEASFVCDLCKFWEIPLFTKKVDLKVDEYKGMSTEEAARTARYKVFEAYLKDKGGKVALGHHMDDQAETVLLNLFRGAGAQGLKGMLPQRESYIRPLLCVDKTWLVHYCTNHELRYVTDESNSDVAYTRNRLRHDIMPLIESSVQARLAEHISRAARLLGDEDRYLRGLAVDAAGRVVDIVSTGVMMDNKALGELPMVIQRRVVRLALEHAMGHLNNLSYDHVEQILGLIHQNRTGKSIHLPKGWQVRTDYEKSFIEALKADASEMKMDQSIDIPGLEAKKTIDVGGYRLKLIEGVDTGDYPQNVYTKWFDYDKIGTNLILRTRRPGDWLRLGKEAHRKKLKNYLIDAKISRPERDKMMLLAQGDEIIWVIGHRMNAYYKVDDTTDLVLEVSLIKEEQQ